jgi:apolipoprotein N-acyltransferase
MRAGAAREAGSDASSSPAGTLSARRLLRASPPVLATGASALLFAASFPPLEIQPLAWIALVPFLVALRGVGTRGVLWLSLLWGLLAAYATGTWFVGSVAVYFDQPYLVGVGFFFFIVATMAGPYYMVFGAAYARLAGRFRVTLPLLGACAWVMIELGRGRLFTGSPFLIGNPWGLIGYSQVGIDPLLQIASVTGIYGVSFAIAAVNVGLAELWLALRGRGPRLREAFAGLLLGIIPAATVLVHGLVLLSGATENESERAVPVAIVQGFIDSGSRWRSDLYGANLELYLRLTLDAFDRGSPEIVFWPEAAMTFFADEEPLYRRAIGSVLRRGGVELVAGAPRNEPGPQGPLYFNSIFLFSERGEIQGRYDKQYPVPFTEYFPVPVESLRRRFGRERQLTAGGPARPLETRAGPAGVVTCNEGMLPEIVSRRVDEGAAYLVNPSNDTWVGDRGFSEMQFDVVLVRAIEQRRTLVRVSTSGPSAIVDPWGRVQARTEPLSRDVLSGAVRSRRDRSLYNRIGDTFAFLCTAVTVAAVFSVRRR